MFARSVGKWMATQESERASNTFSVFYELSNYANFPASCRYLIHPLNVPDRKLHNKLLNMHLNCFNSCTAPYQISRDHKLSLAVVASASAWHHVLAKESRQETFILQLCKDDDDGNVRKLRYKIGERGASVPPSTP